VVSFSDALESDSDDDAAAKTSSSSSSSSTSKSKSARKHVDDANQTIDSRAKKMKV
jgi:hypothetical protein